MGISCTVIIQGEETEVCTLNHIPAVGSYITYEVDTAEQFLGETYADGDVAHYLKMDGKRFKVLEVVTRVQRDPFKQTCWATAYVEEV